MKVLFDYTPSVREIDHVVDTIMHEIERTAAERQKLSL